MEIVIFFSRFLFAALILFISDLSGIKDERVIKVPVELVIEIDNEHNQRANAAGLINPDQN